MMGDFWLDIGLWLAFFGIAALYASVGFGGGSSYLAIMALAGVPYIPMRATALLCNIAVVSTNVLSYLRRNLLDGKRALPIVVAGVPMAFVGGALRMEERQFFLILGWTLLITSLALLALRSPSHLPQRRISPLILLIIGGLVGFLSGMVGIGGGIFLSPILYLIRWDSPHRIAAMSSLYILANSVAGLLGQTVNPMFYLPLRPTLLLLIAVLAGSALGRRMSFRLLRPSHLRIITALLIGVVAFRLLWRSYSAG